MSGTITALEVQQKNPERVNVYLDGEFAFGLNALDAAHLKKGQRLSDVDIERLKGHDTAAQAFERAVRFLAPRPRSSAEIRRHLQEKQYDPPTIDGVIDRLQALNYLDDRQFARYWVTNRNEFNPKGSQALRFELRQKGIDNTIIDETLAELDLYDLAYRAAQKKVRSLRGKDTRTARQTLGAFLQRRGFTYETVRRVLDELVPAKADDDDYEE